jgi:hypothetical protein
MKVKEEEEMMAAEMWVRIPLLNAKLRILIVAFPVL